MYVTITAWVVWTFALDYVNMDSPNLYLANYLPDKEYVHISLTRIFSFVIS